MKKIIHEAESRGAAYHGWLISNHTFSFAGYRNPNRMNFGLLKVLNDDKIIASEGFSSHPHENMEIVSIPISGDLRHEDNMQNTVVIHEDDVQAMSAGTGIIHSERNNSDVQPVEFLQIWINTNQLGLTPEYSQKSFKKKARINAWQLLVSGEKEDKVVFIHQDAFISRIFLQDSCGSTYYKRKKSHGVYFFVIKGKGIIAGEHLRPKDGIGIEYEGDDIHLHAKTDFDVLAIEVPME